MSPFDGKSYSSLHLGQRRAESMTSSTVEIHSRCARSDSATSSAPAAAVVDARERHTLEMRLSHTKDAPEVHPGIVVNGVDAPRDSLIVSTSCCARPSPSLKSWVQVPGGGSEVFKAARRVGWELAWDALVNEEQQRVRDALHGDAQNTKRLTVGAF